MAMLGLKSRASLRSARGRCVVARSFVDVREMRAMVAARDARDIREMKAEMRERVYRAFPRLQGAVDDIELFAELDYVSVAFEKPLRPHQRVHLRRAIMKYMESHETPRAAYDALVSIMRDYGAL
jgi:hypothetical protein